MIRTVTGDIDASAITGTVLAHEHLVLDLTTPTDAAAAVTDDAAVTAELSAARERDDLSLVVDLTCRGMGRDVARTARITGDAGVRLVAATGYYYERFHPDDELDRTPEEVAELLVDEAENGLDGTDILPGVLGEIGSSGVPTPAERTSLVAASLAAQRTGLSVGTHAHLGQGGLQQLDLLTGAGLDPRRICIGHQDLIDDARQHETIARSGAYVAFDTVGKVSYQPDDVRLRMLLEMLEAGLEHQIVLSNDISRDTYLVSRGGTGYGHVLSTFREQLTDRGVDAATLRLLYRDNALAWLEGA